MSLAISMLSRMPAPFFTHVSDRELGRSVGFYPMAGALLGTMLAGSAWLLGSLNISNSIPALGPVFQVTLLALLTGALHLDGVADFADALGSGKTRPKMLEIMKDPRIGAHGACALMLVLAAKIAVFSAMLDRQAGLTGSLLWVGVPMLSRAGLVPVIAFMPGARTGGLGRMVQGKGRWTPLAIATASSGFFCAIAGPAGVASLLASLGVAALIGWAACKVLGGTTGDVYGIIVEICEVTVASCWLIWA